MPASVLPAGSVHRYRPPPRSFGDALGDRPVVPLVGQDEQRARRRSAARAASVTVISTGTGRTRRRRGRAPRPPPSGTSRRVVRLAAGAVARSGSARGCRRRHPLEVGEVDGLRRVPGRVVVRRRRRRADSLDALGVEALDVGGDDAAAAARSATIGTTTGGSTTLVPAAAVASADHRRRRRADRQVGLGRPVGRLAVAEGRRRGLLEVDVDDDLADQVLVAPDPAVGADEAGLLRAPSDVDHRVGRRVSLLASTMLSSVPTAEQLSLAPAYQES